MYHLRCEQKVEAFPVLFFVVVVVVVVFFGNRTFPLRFFLKGKQDSQETGTTSQGPTFLKQI